MDSRKAGALKLPEKVKVGHSTYRFVKMEHREANSAQVYGSCSKQEGLIRIDVTATMDNIRDTMLHEILHACYREWGLRSEDDEERTVTGLATALTTVMCDNPDVRKWFAGQWAR